MQHAVQNLDVVKSTAAKGGTKGRKAMAARPTAAKDATAAKGTAAKCKGGAFAALPHTAAASTAVASDGGQATGLGLDC